MISLRLTFITPLFSKGTYDDRPEIRPPSIRGQLHWWFRALGGSYADEKAIFGGVHGDPVASRVVVRVANIRGSTGEIPTLPHKYGNRASPKPCYLPGTAFDLHLSQRLGGLDARLEQAFRRTVEAWLLAGTLGLRATRAGGSFAWQPITPDTPVMPADASAWSDRCAAVLAGASLRWAILPQTYRTAEDARRDVSDTLGGKDDPMGESDLARLHHPLGKVFGGRKTSPLRFRIIRPDSSYCIAAVWDGREKVTGNRPGDLEGVIRLLDKAGKPIGRALQGASF